MEEKNDRAYGKTGTSGLEADTGEQFRITKCKKEERERDRRETPGVNNKMAPHGNCVSILC